MIFTLPPLFKDGYNVYPAYRYDVELGGDEYEIGLSWNDRAESWHMTILANDGTSIVRNRRISVGTPLCNKLPGELMLVDTKGEGKEATFEGLGVRWLLMWATDEILQMLEDAVDEIA